MSDRTAAYSANPHTSSFVEVVSLCEEFRTAWHPGGRPSIADFLSRVDTEARSALLRNLLAIEIACRRAAGDPPRADEYLGKFPAEYDSSVREAFLPSTASSAPADSTSPAPPATQPVVTRLGEYQLVRELGRGGMGVVYEARHARRQDRVALKTLPAVDGASLHRFKREFRTLAGISHPHLVGLHTLEADGGHWFFTMDLVDGADFLTYVRPGGRLDEARLRSALGQLAAGVMALHARHVIHRDLKPSNVMVTHDGQVVLLDFGLVAELDRAGVTASLEKVAGTPRYMAPEQAAGGGVTAASDWYAVGVMLYEGLSGTVPFRGQVLQVLQDKQRLDAPPLPPDTPDDLAALCMKLLARDPRQRPDALAVTKVVAASPGVAPAAARSGPRLVGRDAHLAALKEAYRAVRKEGRPLTVFVSGRSGEGKTTLGEHFLGWLREDRRLAVMSGRCYDRESVPFKALDALIDALSTYLRGLSAEEAALLIPDDIGALVQVFPVLQRVPAVTQAGAARLAGLDDQQVRRRAFAALRSLLVRVGRQTPIVWSVDDLQWGDADSAEVLFEVLRPPEAPPVLFLGAYRSDETEGSAFLRAWKDLQQANGVRFDDREVRLAPLTEAECVELVVGLVGRDDEAVRRRAAEFARETGGNPFLLVELAGCYDPDADSFEPVPLHEVIGRKLARLPAGSGELLEVVAVSGQALPLDEAARAASQGAAPAATITRMRNERLVRVVGPDEAPLVDTYHDRVRETVLGQMAEDRNRALHLRLAEVIEEGTGGVPAERLAALERGEDEPAEAAAIPRVYDLSYHYDAAGERRKARAYALSAAEQARRQSALEVAVNNYTIAKRNTDAAEHAVRYRIAEGYGHALMLLGRYAEATRQLDGAIDLIDEPERKARIEALQGEIAFKLGAMDQSAAIYESGLRRLGVRVPRSRVGLIYGLLRESLTQIRRGLIPFRLFGTAPTERRTLSVRIVWRLSHPYMFQNILKAVWVHLAGMNRAEGLPPSPILYINYAFHSCVMGMLGWQGRGARYGARAAAMARAYNDLWLGGQCHNYPGIGCYASARYEEGLAHLTEAIGAFEKAGDLWEVNLAHFHKGCCHFGLGDLAGAVAEARWTFDASARLGDSRTMCAGWLWARATRGDIPFEELKGCMPCRPDDVMSTVHAVMAEGLWHRFHGRTAESLAAFERARDMAAKTFCWNSHTILTLPMLVAARRLHAAAIRDTDPAEADRLRRRAYRLARWATRIIRFIPAAYPVALRERALILADYGKDRKALKFADKSCAVAEAQKAKYEHAQSLLVRGQIARQLGLPEADEQIRTAEAAIAEIEKPVKAAGKP